MQPEEIEVAVVERIRPIYLKDDEEEKRKQDTKINNAVEMLEQI